jgi:hypothetical protein
MATVRNQLELEALNPSEVDVTQISPLDINISEFREVKDSLPRDTNIDIGTAICLASDYLRAADRCNEILSNLIWWDQKTKAEKKKTYSLAWLRAKENGAKTDTTARHIAESDEEYLLACQKEIDATTAREYFERKHQTFLKAHHFMKDRVKSEQSHMGHTGGWSESIDAKKNGEVDWNG